VLKLLKDDGRIGGGDFSYPPGLRWIPVCAYSGKRPGPDCTKTALVPSYETEAPPPCDAHVVAGAGPSAARYLLLPPEYDQWMNENHFPRPPARSGGPDLAGTRIVRPVEGNVFVYEPGYPRETQTVEFAAQVEGRPDRVTWVLDGRELATVAWPYTWNWPVEVGAHSLSLKNGSVASAPVAFRVK
jgi:membrane carboxypeptidase/penicillin-binding protein PbpC